MYVMYVGLSVSETVSTLLFVLNIDGLKIRARKTYVF